MFFIPNLEGALPMANGANGAMLRIWISGFYLGLMWIKGVATGVKGFTGPLGRISPQ